MLWKVIQPNIQYLLCSTFANTCDGDHNDDNRRHNQHHNYDDPLGFCKKQNISKRAFLEGEGGTFYITK